MGKDNNDAEQEEGTYNLSVNGPQKIRNRELLSAECFQEGKLSVIIGHLQWEPSRKSQRVR